MGLGQSKYGFVRNNRQSQYPYGAPAYPGPFAPQPPFAPAPAYAPSGYPPAMYPPMQQPQGFIPPGASFGQGTFMPPPQVNYLAQDRPRKRKSRRRNSERFAGGFNPEGPRRQEAQPRRARSESHRRDVHVEAPVVPLAQPSTPQNPAERRPPHRAPTPFITSFPRDDEGDDDEDDRRREARREVAHALSRHSTVHYPEPPPIQADLARVIQPLEPASSAAFGPTGSRPRTPLRNPLPPPPRDLYEMTPYKSLLTLPQTTALLTATYGPQQLSTASGMNPLGPQPTIKRKKSGKGLFRAFSKRDKQPEQVQVRLIPVSVPPNRQPNGQTTTAPHFQVQPAQTLDRSQSQASRRQSMTQGPTYTTPTTAGGPTTGATGGTFGGPGSSPTTSEPLMAPVPPMPSSPPAIRFDQTSPYGVFMNHSSHRVLWQNKIYPTALHLYEALKFLDHRPDIADRIRSCPDIRDVYPLAATFHAFQRPDWGTVFLDLMEEVLYQKFRQHPDLRILLMGTGDARIIYVDADDTYWGSGQHGDGQNELGKALVRVRQRLLAEASSQT